MDKLPVPSTTNNRPQQNSSPAGEEVLVPDARGQLTPAQMVERKLVSMLRASPVLVSHLQSNARRRPR
jgi:hypothetical protein